MFWLVVLGGALVRVGSIGATCMRATVREAMAFFLLPSVRRDLAREIRPIGVGDLAAPRP